MCDAARAGATHLPTLATTGATRVGAALKFSFRGPVDQVEANFDAPSPRTLSNMPDPKRSPDPLYKLLRDEDVATFNERREPGKVYDFRGCTFRGSDLRGLDARGLDLRDCYFRDADLRGVDLREAQLEGASLGSAKISGVYFPADISAEEIRLSVEYGTRLRPTRA
jgi:uncharacterized protein YjbI with pentapeptide repeats